MFVAALIPLLTVGFSKAMNNGKQIEEYNNMKGAISSILGDDVDLCAKNLDCLLAKKFSETIEMIFSEKKIRAELVAQVSKSKEVKFALEQLVTKVKKEAKEEMMKEALNN